MRDISANHVEKCLGDINDWHKKLASNERNVLLRQIWQMDMDWTIKMLHEAGYSVVLSENEYHFK